MKRAHQDDDDQSHSKKNSKEKRHKKSPSKSTTTTTTTTTEEELTPFYNLPHLIITHILGYLQPHEIILKSSVSTKFRGLCEAKELWSRLEVGLDLLPLLPKFQRPIINKIDHIIFGPHSPENYIVPALKEFKKRNTCLKTIELQQCLDCSYPLISIISGIKTLKSLTISVNGLIDDNIIINLAKLPNLERLELTACVKISPAGYFNLLANCKSLKVFVTDEEETVVLDLRTKFPKIKIGFNDEDEDFECDLESELDSEEEFFEYGNKEEDEEDEEERGNKRKSRLDRIDRMRSLRRRDDREDRGEDEDEDEDDEDESEDEEEEEEEEEYSDEDDSEEEEDSDSDSDDEDEITISSLDAVVASMADDDDDDDFVPKSKKNKK